MLQAKTSLSKSAPSGENSTGAVSSKQAASRHAIGKEHSRAPSFLQEGAEVQREVQEELLAEAAAEVEKEEQDVQAAEVKQEESPPQVEELLTQASPLTPISAPVAPATSEPALRGEGGVAGEEKQAPLPLLLPVAGIFGGVRWRLLALGLGTLALLGAAALCAFGALRLCRRRRLSNRLCQEVEKISISRRADLQSMFQTASAHGQQGSQQPFQPGVLSRVEGRVVVADSMLDAPFSGSQCVHYSASVSHRRHDNIHQPPLAFHSAGRDFVLELKDAPHIRIFVSGSDIALFSMERGLREWEQAFTEAPKSWCGFVLEHLVPSADASAHFKKCIDLGSDGVALEFRECALLAGSTVTCVGEVSCDKSGNLRLAPWRVASPAGGGGDVEDGGKEESWLRRAVPWLSGRSARGGRRALGSQGCLLGNVLVSDSLSLQGNML